MVVRVPRMDKYIIPHRQGNVIPIIIICQRVHVGRVPTVLMMIAVIQNDYGSMFILKTSG